MTDPNEAERLLAQALKAQARNAPPAAVSPTPNVGTSEQLAVEPGALPDFRALQKEQDAKSVAASAEENELSHHLPPRYGLLSGADASSLARERAALDDDLSLSQPEQAQDVIVEEGKPIAVGWILTLAIVLGLATGSVMGLLTLL